jgi:hypothetical protein
MANPLSSGCGDTFLDQKPAGVARTSPTVIFSIHGRGRSGQLCGKPGDRCWANRPGLQRLHALGPCCTDAIKRPFRTLGHQAAQFGHWWKPWLPGILPGALPRPYRILFNPPAWPPCRRRPSTAFSGRLILVRHRSFRVDALDILAANARFFPPEKKGQLMTVLARARITEDNNPLILRRSTVDWP